ncbi:MAG: hypothetical protein AB7F86_08525 [Bdellovibrionales bacterium]
MFVPRLRFTRIVALLAFVVFGVTLFQNCGQAFKPMDYNKSSNDGTGGGGGGGTTVSEVGFKAVSEQFFVPNCTACHNSSFASGSVDLSSFAGASSPSLVTRFNPNASKIYQEVTSGAMPQGAPLSPSAYEILRLWILQGARDNLPPTMKLTPDQMIRLPMNSATIGVNASDSDGTIASYGWVQFSGPNMATLTGANSAALSVSGLIEGTYQFQVVVTDDRGDSVSGVSTITVLPVQAAATFAQVNQIVLGKCIGCHTPTGLAPMKPMTTYAEVRNYVVPNQPDASSLYNQVVMDLMPLGGPYLSTTEKDLIRSWIQGGALNN